MGKVSIKNISSATTVLTCDSLRLRRELIPGRAISLDSESFEELSFEPGVQTMIDQGFIKVTPVDEETKDALSGVISESKHTIYSYDEAKEIISKKDYTKFAQALPKASSATKDNFVKAAIELNAVDNAFVELIKKYCGVDVLKAITLRPAN